MNILVTGAKGFIGRNLVENLRNVHDNKNRIRPNLRIEDIFEYDMASTKQDLDIYCRQADFVFHLAGVNRPKKTAEYMTGNYAFSCDVLDALKRNGNKAPVMLASSVQASLAGRFSDSEYGISKLAGEELFFSYAKEIGVKVLVYRFPNVFGKWAKPNYNSAVATFCHAMANDLPFTVNDRNTELELLYIDDLVEAMLDALEGKEPHCEYPKSEAFDGMTPVETEGGAYCFVPTTHKVSLGEIVNLLECFKKQPETLLMPDIPHNSFAKKLYSTYLSYLPKEKIEFPLITHKDLRGSFTELLKLHSCGQISVNIAKPGVTKGEHWHNSKWELFIVVSGHGLIRQRKIGTEEILDFEVSGNDITAVQIIPGYTHSITNLSETENLVTVMWANETFDSEYPDTFSELVEKQ